MLYWIAENTIVACGIALLAAVVSLALHRKPAAGHLLWLCVLVALVAPPLPKLGVLDGRAQAQRLATHVSSNWLAARTASETPVTTGSHEATCKTCQANANARHADHAEGSGLMPAYVTPKFLEQAAHVASIRAKDEPPQSAEMVWASEQQAKAEQAMYEESSTEQASPDQAGTKSADTVPLAAWSPEPRPFDWAGWGMRVALAAWLGGALIALTRLFLGYRGLRALVRETAPADAAFLAEVAATARELGIRPPQVRVASSVSTPFITGGCRPTLVWPRGERLDAPGVRAVLAHELAHLARRDHLAAWFEAIAMCLLWWHPLAHLARSQARRLSERACDAWVIWAYPHARRDYADALLAAVERLTILPRAVPVLGAVDSDKRTLARRLMMIMNGNIARHGSRVLAIGAITLTAVLAPSWATSRLDTTNYTPGYALVRGDIDRSLRPLVEAAQLERLAKSHANAKEFDQAITAYQRLITLRPDDAGAYHDLAMTQYHAGSYAEAAETFSKGAKVAAAHSDTWWQTGGINAEEAKKVAQEAKQAAKEAQAMAAEHAEMAKEHAAMAKEQAAHAAEQIEQTKAQLKQVKSELRASGISDGDIEIEIADLEAEIADAVAQAKEGMKGWDDEDFVDTWSEDFGQDFDFDFDFDLGALAPLADWAYNEACCHALAGNDAAATRALEHALALGYTDADHAGDDSDLASIRETDAFAQISDRMRKLETAIDTAETAFADEAWDDALAAYRIATKLAPDDGHNFHMLAFAALRAGDTELATKGWSHALDLGYNKPTMLYNLACAASLSGETDDAFGYLAKSTAAGFEDYELMKEDPDLDPIRSDSRFDAILTGLIDTAKLQREIETAIEFEEWSTVADKARALADRAPEHSWRKTWAEDKLALGYFYSGRYDQAEAAFATAALDGGSLQNNLYNIGCCRALAGDQPGALDYLHASVDAGWNDAEHLQHDSDLAAVFANPGFEKVVSRAADNQILDQFGVADWDQLHTRASRQIAENPDDGRAHMHLGWALIRTDRAEQAIPVFQRQAELGFAPGIALYNIACCNAILGKPDAAFKALDQAIEAGFNQVEIMADDPDLKNLRSDPRFKKLIAAHASKADAKEAKTKQSQVSAAAPEPDRKRNRD